jgi:hypothetical protein
MEANIFIRENFGKALKVTFVIWSVLIILVGVYTCATLKPTIPVGCESSVIYKTAPWSFVILTGAVDGVYMIYGSNPELYAKIQQGARQAEIILGSGTPITYETLQKVPNITSLLTSQLSLIFRPGDVIDKCDVQILKDYLKMI